MSDKNQKKIPDNFGLGRRGMWTWLSYKGKKKSFEENLGIKVVFDGFIHTLQNLVKTYKRKICW